MPPKEKKLTKKQIKEGEDFIKELMKQNNQILDNVEKMCKDEGVPFNDFGLRKTFNKS
jgi:hypothetical protein